MIIPHIYHFISENEMLKMKRKSCSSRNFFHVGDKSHFYTSIMNVRKIQSNTFIPKPEKVSL